jgi:MFS family permease
LFLGEYVALPAILKNADLRALLAAAVFAGIGFRGQLVAVGWVLLEESDSPFIVGLGIGAFLAPNALLGVLGGAITDRLDRRLVMRLASIALGLNTLLLGVLTLDSIHIWQVVLLSASGGAMWSLFQTGQQSYTFDVVGADDAARGLAIGTLALRAGGVAGALGAGLMLSAWGAGETYITLSGAHLLCALTILLARTRGQAAPSALLPLRQNLLEYAGELRRNRTLAWLIVLMVAAEIFGFSHYSAMPVLIRDELGGDGGDLGVASALASLAGIFAILMFSARAGFASTGIAFIAIIAGYGVSVFVLGQMQALIIAMVVAALVSGIASVCDVQSQVLVQKAVPNEMRGRAMGTWALALGTGPLGHLQMGALISGFGVSTALAINGGLLFASGLAAALLLRRIRRL